MALNYNVQGSVSYTIVGSPTIVDGVVSGFSDNDYIKFSQNFIDLNNTDFECVVKCSNLGVGNKVFRTICNIYFRNLFGLTSNGAPTFTVNTKKTGETGYTQRSVYDWGHVLNTEGDIWYKFSKNGNVVKLQYALTKGNYSTGITYTLEEGEEFNPNTSTGNLMNYGFNNLPSASLDLNETYIKVNGQAWFGVCPVEVKHVVYRTPVDYTVVGSPTIANGVVSGFNGNSNCITTSALSSQLFAADKFEVMLAIIDINSGNIGQDTNGKLFWYGVNNQGISLTTNGLAMMWTYDSANNAAYLWSVPHATGKCYVRFIKNGNTFTFGWSTDKTTWHDKVQEFETLPVGSSYPFYFLTGARAANVSKLDLNETYIKVNGKLWFFHPSTNYLVKDNKLVFADSGVYIDDNGTKTYASANIAPVPSGFTYGTTTTTDVGLVDMTTQAFTAVPGATWGKDE